MNSKAEKKSPLENLAEFTGQPVAHYDELLQAMLEEDRVECFAGAVAMESALPVKGVRALLKETESEVQ